MTERTVVVRLRAEVAEFKRAIGDATKAVDALPASAQKAETSLGRMVQSAEHNRQSWDLAGGAMLGVGTAAVVGLGMASKAAIDWEAQWTGVLKTVSGTPEELAAVEDGLRTLAKTLPSTHTEIAAVAEAAGQLGVKTKDVVSFTKVMIDLGETTNLTADEAATSIAQLMNVMGTAPKDVGRLGAALVALGNDGASTERDIIQMAQRISGAGKIVGLTEGEVMGLANALASVGIEVEAGGSAISTVMTDMAKAVEQGGKDLEGFAGVAGMSGAEFAAAFKTAPAEAIATFIEGLGSISAAGGDVFTTLQDLGQSDVRVSRALLTMASSGDLLRESLALGNSAWADNTALAIEAGKRYDTTAAKLEIARNGIQDTAITIGEAFLPMLAEAAEGVAGFADFIGGLPEPLLNAAAGLTGVAGMAALAGGAFLLTFPRVMETVKAFRLLNDINAPLASSLRGVGRAAGIVGAVMAAGVVINGLLDGVGGKVAGIEETTKALLAMGDGVTEIDAKFTALSSGGFINDFEGMSGAMDKLINPSLINRFDDLNNEFWTLGKSSGSFERTKVVEQFDNVGKSLASLVTGGNIDLARTKFEQIRGEWEASGGSIEDLRDLLPDYVAALDGAGNSAELAGEGNDILTASAGRVTAATDAETKALEEWMQMVSDADASFIDLVSGYDAVIQKNTEIATSTADATKSSTDSWEDYYDGQTVSSTDYIAELQRQVDAQTNWEDNMLAISDRVQEGMTGDMATAATNMIDELLNLGPEGAAQVQLLKDMSDAEFAKVVELWSQKGTQAVTEFTNKVESYRQPVININANAGAAQAAYDGLGRPIDTTVTFSVRGYEDARAKYDGLGRPIASGAGWKLGGYTGDGGVDDVAGVVHGKEFVSNARATAEHRGQLEAWNRGAPGYKDGGYVTPRYMSVVPQQSWHSEQGQSGSMQPIEVSIGSVHGYDPDAVVRKFVSELSWELMGG